MKAIFCGYCSDIKALSAKGSVTCECGNVTGWWVDSEKGTAKVFAKAKGVARVIGINNSFLIEAFQYVYMNGSMSDKQWRELAQMSCDKAEGYLFHKDRRNCPFVIIKVGESSDITWSEMNYEYRNNPPSNEYKNYPDYAGEPGDADFVRKD